MRNIQFTHIRIENFCGIKSLDTDLHPITLIKGRNRQGKSTVRNAIMWCLTDKMADGKSATSIRPHDENGIDIDFVDIVVEVTLSVDGREIRIKKTQKQDWFDNRQTQKQELKGNNNEFAVNDIPKKEKDYKAYLEENVAPLETLTYCLTPFAFLSLNKDKRREKLNSLIPGIDAMVMKTNDKFLQLEDMLRDGKIEEIIKRSKTIISDLKKEKAQFPIRIDEVAKQIVDMDFAELELQKNDIERQIKENADKRAEDSKTSELGAKIMDLKFNLSGIANNLNDALRKQKSKIDYLIYELVRYKRDIDSEIESKENLLKQKEDELRLLEINLSNNKDNLDTAIKSVFNENSLVCPNCKQEYPSDKKDEIKAEFERTKAEDISNLQVEISSSLEKQKSLNEEIKLIENHLQNLRSTKADTEQNLKLQEENLAKLPQTVDVSQNEEYQKLAQQIEDMETEYERILQREKEDLDYLKSNETELRNKLTDVKSKLMQKDINIKAEDRIAELKAEQRKVSQQIADEERQLDLLEEFNRAKINMITDKINSYFDVIKWQMFKQQVNGGYAEVCYPIVKGTNYDGNLNNGDKILAEIDICRAFQKANDVELPIIADNLESLDEDRIPKIDNQMIVLRRSDCDLEITEG